ncbi:MAG: hypothetical protein CM15mP127_10960 [Gammaproteobacteria bacterium]|nr:MAG: hypothetical protein CM15mP127_10960 [Gammaproteobacteria bacterium]
MMLLITKLKKGESTSQEGPKNIYGLGYLNDVEEGGATEFRDLNISIPPKKGAFLVWKNILPGTTKFILPHCMQGDQLPKAKNTLLIYGLEKINSSK